MRILNIVNGNNMKILSFFNNLIYALALIFSAGQDPHVLLTEEIKRNCSITEDIAVFRGSSYFTHYKPSLLEECSLCGSLAKYVMPMIKTSGNHVIEHASEGTWEYKLGKLYQIAALYHEMGHIHHSDGSKAKAIDDRLKMNHLSFERLLEIKKHDYVSLHYTALLKEKEFAHELERIAGYVDRAQQFFKNKAQATILGRYLAKLLREEKTLWNPPVCLHCLQEKKYKRGVEARADLFAADKMWLHGRVDVLTAILYLHASSGLRVAGPQDIHPSGVERALMFVGFLQEKGVDFNVLIAEFEKNPIEEIHKNEKLYLLSQVGHELVAEHSHHSLSSAHANASHTINH
jgi:hypothetical protein